MKELSDFIKYCQNKSNDEIFKYTIIKYYEAYTTEEKRKNWENYTTNITTSEDKKVQIATVTK